jgi:hypothetical protein
VLTSARASGELMDAPRVLVAYADATGLDEAAAIEVAQEISAVPGLEVDLAPLSRVPEFRQDLWPHLSAWILAPPGSDAGSGALAAAGCRAGA